jgi:hypothetical protein
MKAKKIAKRLRARSNEFHLSALGLQPGDSAFADRARLVGDVLQEIADQVAPLSKKQAKKQAKRKAKQEAKQAAALKKAKSANGEHLRRDSAAA